MRLCLLSSQRVQRQEEKEPEGRRLTVGAQGGREGRKDSGASSEWEERRVVSCMTGRRTEGELRISLQWLAVRVTHDMILHKNKKKSSHEFEGERDKEHLIKTSSRDATRPPQNVQVPRISI